MGSSAAKVIAAAAWRTAHFISRQSSQGDRLTVKLDWSSVGRRLGMTQEEGHAC